MAKKNFWLGMLAMVLALGMSVVGCDNGTTSNVINVDGVWVSREGIEVHFRHGEVEIVFDGILLGKGIFTISGNNITFHPTHMYIDSVWANGLGIDSGLYTRSELITALQNSLYVQDIFTDNYIITAILAEENITFEFDFSPSMGIVNGNTLIWEGAVFTR